MIRYPNFKLGEEFKDTTNKKPLQQYKVFWSLKNNY